jgi:hypothetical protein
LLINCLNYIIIVHKPIIIFIPVFELQIYINIVFNNEFMLYLKSEIRTLFLLFLSLSLLIPMYGFSGGTGTLAAPFQVYGCDDLDNISNYLSSNFTQMSNVDCSVYSSGSGFDPIGGIFTGSYDGKGLNISNLFINRSASDFVGLFNQTNGAIINNTNLININISGNNYIGGLVGFSTFSSSFSSSSSSGTVNGNNYVGGLVGYSQSSSSVSASSSSGTVDGSNYIGGLVGFSTFSSSVSASSSSGSVNGNSQVGGLVGSASSSSSISNSYSSCSVNGTNSVGGLVGYSFDSSVSNSFSTGAVTGGTVVGGFIGDYASGDIITSFWNNHSGNVNQTFGSGTNINVTSIDDNISRFYGNSLVPMSNWDPVIWDFYNTTLPHLAMENYVVASSPAPSSSVSITSLPSFGFGAVVLALIGIVLFLF